MKKFIHFIILGLFLVMGGHILACTTFVVSGKNTPHVVQKPRYR